MTAGDFSPSLRLGMTLLVIALIAACAPPPAPKPAPQPVKSPTGDMRYLVDPRTGYDKALPPAQDRRFNEAWQLIVAGDFAGGRRVLDAIRAKEPNYVPVQIAEASIDLVEGRVAQARATLERVLTRNPYFAADVLDAELLIAEKKTRRAYEAYRQIASRPNAPPTAAERVAQLGREVFDQLFAAAQAAPDAEAIRLLREALAIAPESQAARLLLAQKLVATHQYEEARKLLNMPGTDFTRPEVQETYAELEIGEGFYQGAIDRYERLARETKNPKYAARLDEIKEQFAHANMPPQYRRALENQAITRADLAILMYWGVNSIRFAQNLGVPPIATDIGEIPGRDEVIRAIALGIYQVDPVTRRVSPLGPVTNGSLARIAARVLILRGAPCAKGPFSDPTELGRAQKVLAACNVDDPSLASPDLPASGRAAEKVMDLVDRAIK
ncbi:MAG TPA: tetratricopeptide repeat protein [Thermoanaerobaculia bacterium]|jgi:thioredoxin-like negative regulator of GroEL